MKLILKILYIIVVILVILWLYSFFQTKFNKGTKDKEIVSVTSNANSFDIKINRNVKDTFKKMGAYLSDLFYKQAARFNPRGDIVPDKIDNEIKKEIKERIN